jgi:hypothetical protein
MTSIIRTTTTALILTAVFIPLQGYSYGTVGHASQQLRLLASTLIQPALNRQALTVRVPQLPHVVLNTEPQSLRRQLDVLVAEDLIESESIVAEQRELTSSGWVTRTTSGVQYLPGPGGMMPDIRYGNASLVRLGEISLDPQDDGRTEARISFEWQVDDLAEWVWAPVFDSDERLNLIKASQQAPISASANLEWNPEEQRWLLVDLQPF